MVIILTLPNDVDLTAFINNHPELDIQYEPEIFPGLILHYEDPKFTALLFSSGKISIVGVREIEAISMITNIIQDLIYD